MAGSLPLEPALPAAGTLLIASPRLLDPNFMHAVVLLCAHGPEGTHGLIVNRPGTVTVADLGSDHLLLQGRDDRIWLGGPVQQEALQVVHRLGPGIPGSLAILGDVHLGGDPTVVRAALDAREGGADVVRFVLGYSGWGEGQLDQELAEGSWIVSTATPDLVFDPEPRTVWRRALRAMGGPFSALADEPPDPSWN